MKFLVLQWVTLIIQLTSAVLSFKQVLVPYSTFIAISGLFPVFVFGLLFQRSLGVQKDVQK